MATIANLKMQAQIAANVSNDRQVKQLARALEKSRQFPSEGCHG